MNFDQITSRLFIGGHPPAEDFIQALHEAGVTHILDVTDEHDDTSLLAQHPNIDYLYNPTPDDRTHKTPPWFSNSLTFALGMMPKPRTKLYVHCTDGIFRAPGTGYAILRALGWTGSDASALIKAKRPAAQDRYFADADAAIIELGFQ